MDDFEQLKASDLQELLRARGLSTSYRLKAELITRLRNSRPISVANTDITINTADDSIIIVDDGSSTTENGNVEQTAGSSDQSGEDNTVQDDEVFLQNETIVERQAENNDNESFSDEDTHDEEMASFTPFRDVEDALEKFHGRPHEDLKKWIDTFDKIAETCKWNEIQKYLFTRKLMAGAARKSIEADATLMSYAAVIAHLKEEFKDETTFLDVHTMLTNKKKSSKESYVEYFFDMLKIGNEKMDEKSMIRYIVDGLPGDTRNKLTLYQSKTTPELKANLKVYEAVKKDESEHDNRNQRDKGKKNESKSADKRDNKHRQTQKRCVNCGDKTHSSDECPDKEKGRKCFNCEAFGHLSKDCRKPKKLDGKKSTKPGEAMCIEASNPQRMRISITVGSKQVTAVLDTGSQFTLMTRTAYKTIYGQARWKSGRITMKGLATKEAKSLGYVELKFKLNNDDYQVECHVMEDGLLPVDVLLGRNFLLMADITIRQGIPTITKFVNELPENDVMVIEPQENTLKVEELPCITNIQNDELRHEVMKLVKGYTPKKIEKSSLQMEILLTDNIPVYQHPRRLSAMERDVVKEMVGGFLREGIVRPSKSPYASPILLRRKKNGTYRFCVDYRKLNEKVIKDRFPLPLMEDVLDALFPYSVFSSIDLRNGFYHVDMHPDSIRYTAFITPDGQYEFLKAPFGLCNSPAVFQRYINDIFHEAQRNELAKLYLDDINIPSVDETTNLEKLEKIFNLASENGLLINFSKCHFLQRKITFLGYVVENQTIKPSEEKTRAITVFPKPTTIKAVQSFLGLTGFFRKFVEHYAIIARPLTQLLKEDSKFIFGPAQETAFETLKTKLCSDPVLRLYNPKAETELHTDASALGYGGCLMQKQADDALMHPIYYLSFKTTPAEAKLHSYELEVLAIIRCLERLRPYLLGIPYTIYTDCQAFQLTMSKKNATAKVARWALALEEYDLTVKHRAGTSMKHVDALSRNFVMVVEDGLLYRIRNAQLADDECKLTAVLIQKKAGGNYVQRDGIIYHFEAGYYRLKVPKAMIQDVLKTIHGDSHLGKRRMEITANQDYDIADLGKNIEKLLRNCLPCILATKKMGKQEGWLNPIEKFNVPLHTYHIDHLGPIASTRKNYNHILAVVDAFTKFTWLYPTKSTTCAEAIDKLKRQQATFGNPYRIIADKGSAFTADEFGDYCNEQKIHLHLVTTATPRGNGQVERINRIIIPIITKLSIEEPAKWFQHVERVQRSINSVVSRSTGNTPFNLMFGVSMNNPEDLDLAKVIEQELMTNFVDDRAQLRQEAAANILQIQEENKRQFNKKRKEPRLYVVGDLVAIERVQKEKGMKVKSKMVGPYEITKVKRNHRYEVRKIGFNDGPINTSVPVDRIKPWAGDDHADDE